MLRRGVRRLHFGRKPAKVSATKSEVSTELVRAAQQLRSQLNGSEKFQTEETAKPLDQLTALVSAMKKSPKVPDSVFRLISQTLQTRPNYKGELSAQSLQLVFRAVAQNTAQLDLATKLYADLYRHSKLSSAERLENGREYYRLLRTSGFLAESDKLVHALLRDNADAVTEEYIMGLMSIAVEETDQQVERQVTHRTGLSAYKGASNGRNEAGNAVSEGLLAIIESYPSGAGSSGTSNSGAGSDAASGAGASASASASPPPAVLTQCIQYLTHEKSVYGLERLASYMYFSNPHFVIPNEVSIVLLDAFLQLPLAGGRGGQNDNVGRKVLKLCLARVTTDNTTPLEVCELFLMCCVHFQEPVSSGLAIYNIMESKYDARADYTKETWDVLAQWSVYFNTQPLEALKGRVISEMPSEYVDSSTLRSVLIAASDKAQCSEQQISALVEYFKETLGVWPDAAAYEILIRRALSAVEIDRARQIFAESNTDWNADNNAHTGVLNDLLVAMCRTPSISRQLIVDTYQRVRLFMPVLSLDAQVALLEMFLQESQGDSATPAGVFVIEQFGDRPDLPFERYRPVFDLFFTRILAAKTEAQAWDLFGILNCTVRLPYEAYYPLQQKLCSLGRPDAAHLLFRQLRSRSKKDGTQPPGNEMYLMLFAEYAKWRYEEGVHELETYFRLDLNNEMTTQMMNRMLGAYAALEDGHKVSYLWAEAVALPRGSIHGPNSETMSIMLQFFSTSIGLEAVDDLWTSMPSEFKIAPTQQTLKQYIIANCYHGYYTRALQLVRTAPQQYNLEINGDILQALYNWTMLPNRKQEVKEYALEHFPKEWARLEHTPDALKDVTLPTQDEMGRSDETSLRLAAIKQLEEAERAALVTL